MSARINELDEQPANIDKSLVIEKSNFVLHMYHNLDILPEHKVNLDIESVEDHFVESMKLCKAL